MHVKHRVVVAFLNLARAFGLVAAGRARAGAPVEHTDESVVAAAHEHVGLLGVELEAAQWRLRREGQLGRVGLGNVP